MEKEPQQQKPASFSLFRTRTFRWILVSSGALVVLGFCICVFGNPQWNKWIYMTQYALAMRGVYDPSRLEPPEGYTGIWVIWSGRKAKTERRYKAGFLMHVSVWNPDGSKSEECWFEQGRPRRTIYYQKGAPWIEYSYADGMMRNLALGRRDGERTREMTTHDDNATP